MGVCWNLSQLAWERQVSSLSQHHFTSCILICIMYEKKSYLCRYNGYFDTKVMIEWPLKFVYVFDPELLLSSILFNKPIDVERRR